MPFLRAGYTPLHSDGGYLVHPSGDAVYSDAIALISRVTNKLVGNEGAEASSFLSKKKKSSEENTANI